LVYITNIHYELLYLLLLQDHLLHILVISLKFIVFHIQKILFYLQLLVVGICLCQICMQKISFHSDLLQILVVFFHVVNLLSGYFYFCQYFIFMFLDFQLCFELFLLLQSPLQILNKSTLLFYNLLVFLFPNQKI
jgi:hypothetical protein